LIADDLEASDLPRLVQIRRGIGATAKHQSPRSPAELIDPSGRRLILVVSDCVSPQWRDGKLTKTLELWAKQGSIAIVQMLPKWLWKRTALGRASEVRLQGLNPGEFNQKLIAKGVSLWDELEETRGVKVPVFTLEPDRVATWAQMLSGKGSTWTAGYVFKLDPIPARQGQDLFNLDVDRSNPEQRVQAFRVTASPMARKLAGLLAAAPVISLPIVRLIQETLLKESQQVHVAEVFLGGLLKPLSEINPETNPNYVQYEFIDGVRELLADSVPSGYVLDVVDAVSKYVARKVGLSLEEFAAVLRNPQQLVDGAIAEQVRYFATITARVLRSLGGEYVKVAEELVISSKSSHQINSKDTIEQNYNLLWKDGSTKVYSFHTDRPWDLSFDALVIPVGIYFGFGGLAESFRYSLKNDSVYLDNAINAAKVDLKQFTIKPSSPLTVLLPSRINHLLFPLDRERVDRFIILATVESPQVSIENAGKAIESVIKLAIDRGLKYIVIPLIGTGLNQLPVRSVAFEILTTIHESIRSLTFNTIEKIILVDKKESTILVVNETAQYLFNFEDTDKIQVQLKKDINYNKKINDLALKAREYPAHSIERNKILNELITTITYSGKLFLNRSGFSGEIYQDALQETWVRIIESFDSYETRNIMDFTAFFNKILRYTLSKKKRDEIEFEQIEDPAVLDEFPQLIEDHEYSDSYQKLLLFIKEDPENILADVHISNNPHANFRDILLRRLEGQTWQQISTDLHVNPSKLSLFFQKSIKENTRLFKEYLDE
jgi:DNA-directed RNA polymerase specialized sigma24 family protein